MKNECAECSRPRIVGQALTNYICTVCQQEKTWPDTGVPRICPECAEKKGLCTRCGKSLKGGDSPKNRPPCPQCARPTVGLYREDRFFCEKCQKVWRIDKQYQDGSPPEPRPGS